MIQPFHFWVFIQRKQNHYFDKISVLLYSLNHHCKTWKQPTYPLMDKWVQEMWYVHTHTHTHTHTEHYSAMKKETLPFATTWMKSESIMLSELSQTQKHK